MVAISTALSDLVLAVTSFYAAYHLRGIEPRLPSYGLLIFALAASMGVYRFGVSKPLADMVHTHKLLSWLGNLIGVPFQAAGVLFYNGHPQVAGAMALECVFCLAIYKYLSRNLRDLVNTLNPTFAVMAMIFSSALTTNYYGLYAGLGIILAGVLIGTEGSFAGVPKIDLFHYALAMNNFVYMVALGVKPF